MAINYETRTQAYIDVDSSFGTASVNLVDGNLSFNHTDWEFGGGPTAFSLSHVYAGANYNNNQFYTGLNTGNGYGWKTNFDQYLIGDTTGAIYIDASGRKHTFKNSNGTIYDDGGLGLKLTKVNGTGPCKIVTDLVGNTMHFSATGYLCRIDTIFGNSIFVRHNANGSIKEIENGDNVATFTYNTNGLLSSVSYTGASETLNFEYSNGYLTTIKKTIGSSVSIQAQFAYTDNRLSRIYGNDYTDTRVTYSSDKVNQISTCPKSQGTALSYTTFTYTSANEAYATNEQGVKFKYTIHNNGDIVKIEEVIGTALYEVFPDKYPDDKQITDYYLGTSKLDDIASLNRAGSVYASFDNTSTNANHLTVDDIRATLQSFAKGNSTFDIFYNNKKDRIAGATAESYSFRNKSNGSVLFSYDMLSEITKVYDKNNSLAVTYTTKETVSSSGVLAVTTQTLASGSSTDIKQTFTKYNGQTTYTIETDPDNRYNLRTDYGYDDYGNLLSTVKKDINGTLSGTISSYKTSSSGNGNTTSETDERGKTSYYTYESPYNIIKSITSPKNVKKSFNYDAFKEKLTSVSCNTDGKTFTNTINTSNNRMTSVTNATGTYTFAYDSNTGDLTQVTSSSGTVLYKNSFNYSTHTNTKTYHDNSTETTTYDKYGNISSVTHGGKTASFTYQDKNGTLNSKAKVKTITDGFAGTTNTYDKTETDGTKTIVEVNDTLTSGKGSWIKKNYISGSKAISEYLVGGSNRVDTTNDRMLYYTESYDGFGKPISRLNISHNNTFTHTVSVDYEKDRFNRTTERHIAAPGSYVTKNYTYADSGTRRVGLISKETSTYSNGNTESRSYTYDDNGNITKIAISGTDGSKTISYTYDNLNRITKEVNGETGSTINYAYDNGGNITSQSGTNQTYNSAGNLVTTNISRTYTYNSSWKDLLTSFNGQSIVYNNGYPTTYKGKSLTWSRGKLVTYNNGYGTNFNYTYDVNGRKTKVERGISEICYFFYDGDKLVAEHWYTPSGTTPFVKVHYLYDDQGIVGFKAYKNGENNNNYEYFTVSTDILGNVVRIDNANGWVTKISYDAFGAPTYKNNTNNSPALGYSPQTFFKLAYKGYYYDPDLKLYYLMSRYYDPETGRFISPDHIDYLEPETITGVNLYSYCYNNPIMYTDPSGHLGIALSLLFASIIIGGTIGGIAAGISSCANGDKPHEVALKVLGGALLGGALGASLAIGAGVAAGGTIASLTAAESVAAGLSLSLIGSSTAGAINSIINQQIDYGKIDHGKLLSDSSIAAFKGLISFGTGLLTGAAGLWKATKNTTLIRGSTISKTFLNFSIKSMGCIIVDVVYAGSKGEQIGWAEALKSIIQKIRSWS